jgi:hypothetical protein
LSEAAFANEFIFALVNNRLMSEYDFIFETPYAISKGQEYPCTIDRPKGEERGVSFYHSHFSNGSTALRMYWTLPPQIS